MIGYQVDLWTPASNLIIIGLLLAMILAGVGGIVFLVVYLRRQSKEK